MKLYQRFVAEASESRIEIVLKSMTEDELEEFLNLSEAEQISLLEQRLAGGAIRNQKKTD